MAVLLSHPPDSLAVECLPHKTWTRDEVAVLESTGLFAGTHFELIDGELIDKMPKNRRHVDGTRKTRRAFAAVFGEDRVDQEAPIDVAEVDNPRNEPEPDVAVLGRSNENIGRNPVATEVLLVVEVSDSTLHHDLTTKTALYARAGIPEYWALDINGQRLFVHRDPVDGIYQSRTEHGASERVQPLGTDQSIPVAALLP